MKSTMAISQDKSPLFSIPRELCDEIYSYYVYQARGYRLNTNSGKLRGFDDRPIDLALMHTCRIIFKEMKGVALKTNKVTFTTIPSNASSTDGHPNALRFKLPLQTLTDDKFTILSHAAVCITPEVAEKVEQLHSGNVLCDVAQAIARELDRELDRNLLYRTCIRGLEYYDVLDDILQLISKHPQFDVLASEACFSGVDPRWLLFLHEGTYNIRVHPVIFTQVHTVQRKAI